MEKKNCFHFKKNLENQSPQKENELKLKKNCKGLYSTYNYYVEIFRCKIIFYQIICLAKLAIT